MQSPLKENAALPPMHDGSLSRAEDNHEINKQMRSLHSWEIFPSLSVLSNNSKKSEIWWNDVD